MPTREQFVERQRVLAEFGELALRSEDLQEILTEGCKLVGRALGTDFAKILQIESDDTLLVRAGVGWPTGVVGETHLAMHERTSEAFAIREGKPVITRDINEEKRFDFPRFMAEAGVVAVVNVPIRLPGGEAYGLLQVDSREARDFDWKDTEFLRTYAMILGPVIDRLFKVHSLEQAVEKNQRLLRELEHRIKNNIGVIRSLINTRAHEAQSEETKTALVSVGQRVETLRLVHEQLYSIGVVDKLPLRPYLSKLVQGLHELHDTNRASVALDIDIDDVELPTDTSVPLGLIVNEFVTNSLKYAFDGGDGTVAVAVKALAEDRLHVRLSDNGKGLPSHSGQEQLGTGVELMKGLSWQIGGKAEIASSRSGTVLEIEFPVPLDPDLPEGGATGRGS